MFLDWYYLLLLLYFCYCLFRLMVCTQENCTRVVFCECVLFIRIVINAMFSTRNYFISINWFLMPWTFLFTVFSICSTNTDRKQIYYVRKSTSHTNKRKIHSNGKWRFFLYTFLSIISLSSFICCCCCWFARTNKSVLKQYFLVAIIPLSILRIIP